MHHTLDILEGSSPLARGLRRCRPASCAPTGIIPARAGFTFTIRACQENYGDHPRSRGVYFGLIFGIQSQFGSSPLARGLPQDDMRCPVLWGIIPARAGFTRYFLFSLHQPPDHPRSRGVYYWGWGDCRNLWGSSPLARGLPHPETTDDPVSRIIPARAGFTVIHFINNSANMDHPRSCGVYRR